MVNIKQKEGESLRDCVSYFNVAMLEVRDLDQSVTMSTPKSGLLKCKFLFFSEKRYLKDFTKMLAWMEKYANTKQAMELYESSSKRKPKGKKKKTKEKGVG